MVPWSSLSLIQNAISYTSNAMVGKMMLPTIRLPTPNSSHISSYAYLERKGYYSHFRAFPTKKSRIQIPLSHYKNQKGMLMKIILINDTYYTSHTAGEKKQNKQINNI